MSAPQSNPEPMTALHIKGIVEDLTKLVEVENRALTDGLPAGLAQTAARKFELARALDRSLVRMGEPTFRASAQNADIGELAGRLQQLRLAMGENTSLIKRSLEASRRRIDAIMRSLRNAPGRQLGYGADARRLNATTGPANDRQV